MPIHRFVVRFTAPDPRSAGFLSDAHALGFVGLKSITCQDLYFIEGQLSAQESQQLALELLSDPVTQDVENSILDIRESNARLSNAEVSIIEVALRPGVTDPVAEQIVRAAHELGFDGVQRAATGLRFKVEGLSAAQVEKLAKQLLANNVIQH